MHLRVHYMVFWNHIQWDFQSQIPTEINGNYGPHTDRSSTGLHFIIATPKNGTSPPRGDILTNRIRC